MFKAGVRYERHTKSRRKKRKSFSKNTRKIILLLQSFCCRNCGIFLNVMEFDHIDGDNTNNLISNCQALCPNCHAKKTRKRKI